MIRAGTAGWSYPDWEGIVYPKKKPRGFHGLEHLAGFLDCVEVNSSFYRPTDPAHARRWAGIAAAHAGFRLLAKLHRAFTHEAHALPEAGELASAAEWRAAAAVYRRGIDPLAEAGVLAAVLAQFPVTFARTPAGEQRLEHIAAHFAGYPLAVELRHRSWFEPEPLARLRALGLSLIHIDLPAARDHPPEGFEPTGPIGYLRLHGRNAATWFAKGAGRDQRYDYLYSREELEGIAARAKRLAGEHDQTYVVTNNHFAGQAVANAIELKAMLSGAPVSAPPELVERYPRLAALTRVQGQGRLF